MRMRLNLEHLWGWDVADVESMLDKAGWVTGAHELFTPESNDFYTFQFWVCE